MALQKDMNYKGLDIPNAYLKIIGVSGDKNSVFYTIGVFVNKEQSLIKDNSIKNYGFSFKPLQEDNSIRWDKQAYEDAKTREVFIGVIDLLDEEQIV